ncbi:DUF4235 domain-containing protein [Thermomonospora umbrina]|uniref:Uncharacterized protein DUF4235 n=1 Tax=Thermomonospora umbrina TaxID=111806 RepID=A0A3D9SW31_9ACTN|nr:DUF4235 domain-containing protein [Thermomonospora umbrina]REE95851.1 uncharacterized protein DUF4235 [Thermomonospora umbrina]
MVYRVMSLVFGVLGGLIAGMLFKRLWKLAAGEDATPDAEDLDRGWVEVMAAAAMQGAILGMVRGASKRASATGKRRKAERKAAKEPAGAAS